MAQVHVRKVGVSDCIAERLIESSRRRSTGAHTIATGPLEADLLIFAGSDRGDLSDILSDPVFRQYPEKSAVVYEGDWCLPLIKGVYTNLECPTLTKGWAVSGHYTKVAFWDDLDDLRNDNADLLFSFLGRMKTASVRRNLPQGQTSVYYVDEALPMTNGSYRQSYLDVLGRSRFVLCPRGYGVSSIRIFETMKAGRVPVILSDGWIPPSGPEWESCSIRIPERLAQHVETILADYDPHWPNMAANALRTFQQWFSLESQFDRIVDWCLSLGVGNSRHRWSLVGGGLQQLHRFRPAFIARKFRRVVFPDYEGQ